MTHIRKIVILTVLFTALITGRVYAEDIPTLTLDDCVKAALANNPKLKEAVANVDLNKAGIGSAKSAYLPQLSTTGSYIHYDTSKVAFGSFALSGNVTNAFPAVDKRYEVLSENTSVSQLIWDFGQTLNRIKFANETLSASQYEFLETQENTILNAEKGYFDAMRAQLLLEAAKDNFEMMRVHLGRTEGFFEVGFRQAYDVTKDEVNVANANLDLVTAKKNFEMSKVTLNNIMGNTGGTAYRVVEIGDFKPDEINLEEALKAAASNRVELSKLQARARAAQADLAAKKKGNWPVISVGGSHQVSDTSTPGVGNVQSWNAGPQISWPWFDGFKTKSEVEAAQANLKLAQLGIQDETLNIALEVQSAVLSLGESKERIVATAKLLQQSKEYLDIANARYEEGLGSIIEVTDAENSVVSARQGHASAIADYLTASASYQKSIGVISQGIVK
ncbi:MAG: TolC family protein [Candidatus Omnitrophota bacterium]|jgi:outer membrane protein TolC